MLELLWCILTHHLCKVEIVRHMTHWMPEGVEPLKVTTQSCSHDQGRVTILHRATQYYIHYYRSRGGHFTALWGRWPQQSTLLTCRARKAPLWLPPPPPGTRGWGTSPGRCCSSGKWECVYVKLISKIETCFKDNITHLGFYTVMVNVCAHTDTHLQRYTTNTRRPSPQMWAAAVGGRQQEGLSLGLPPAPCTHTCWWWKIT